MGSVGSHLRAPARLIAAASPRVAWVRAIGNPREWRESADNPSPPRRNPYLKRNQLTLPMLVVPSKIK